MAAFTIRYNWRTTGLSEEVLRVEATSPAQAMELAFDQSGHADRSSFFRDLEAVPA